MIKINNFIDILNEIKKGRRLTNSNIKFDSENNYIFAQKFLNKVDIYLISYNSYPNSIDSIKLYNFNTDDMFNFDNNKWEIKKYKLYEVLMEYNYHCKIYKDKNDIKKFFCKIRRLSWEEDKFIPFDPDIKICNLTFEDLNANDWEIIGKEFKDEFKLN